eukprot:4670227-Prymnesium_polylepis.1
MAILSIPEAFLVYTGCKDSAEFANAIVHISCAFDYLQVLAKHKEDPAGPRSDNKINNIAWQDDDGVCEFLGVLHVEAKFRLRIVQHAEVTRNDMRYYAVATSDLNMRECVKNQMKFSRCEFGVSVVYKREDGTITRRILLFPTTLLNIEQIPHDGLYSIITIRLIQPMYWPPRRIKQSSESTMATLNCELILEKL